MALIAALLVSFGLHWLVASVGPGDRRNPRAQPGASHWAEFPKHEPPCCVERTRNTPVAWRKRLPSVIEPRRTRTPFTSRCRKRSPRSDKTTGRPMRTSSSVPANVCAGWRDDATREAAEYAENATRECVDRYARALAEAEERRNALRPGSS